LRLYPTLETTAARLSNHGAHVASVGRDADVILIDETGKVGDGINLCAHASRLAPEDRLANNALVAT